MFVFFGDAGSQFGAFPILKHALSSFCVRLLLRLSNSFLSMPCSLKKHPASGRNTFCVWELGYERDDWIFPAIFFTCPICPMEKVKKERAKEIEGECN